MRASFIKGLIAKQFTDIIDLAFVDTVGAYADNVSVPCFVCTDRFTVDELPLQHLQVGLGRIVCTGFDAPA